MLALLLILGGMLFSGQEKKMKRTFEIPGDGPGYDLLRTLADEFGIYAVKSTQEFQKVSDNWIAQAKQLKEKGKIDEVFFKRYKQLAIVCKLVMVPDKQGILQDLIIKEINKFGVKALDKDFQFQGLRSVAAKLTEEILDLKKYLDNM
jgi:hypothetical protein